MSESRGKEGPYCLVLDANAWIAERLLQSSAGSAVLYAVAANGASIGLPEVVELEVNQVLRSESVEVAASLQKNLNFLRQLSGHWDVPHPVPTEKAINEGIVRRWDELSGTLLRAPFSFEQAQSALRRILRHASPSGKNNEQFRDCCIWECVLDFSRSYVVHFVTNDSAFYQNRGHSLIADALRDELAKLARRVKIYPTVGEFLAADSHQAIATLERDIILDALVEAVTPNAHQIAMENAAKHPDQEYELSNPYAITIKGYATPKQSIVAVTFGISFDLLAIERTETSERQRKTTLRLDGSCSYSPSLRKTSDVVISRWSHSLKESSGSGGWSNSTVDPALFSQIQETRYI